MYLDEYLKSNARAECIELNNMINKGMNNLETAVVSLLLSHKTSRKQISLMKKKFNAEKN